MSNCRAHTVSFSFFVFALVIKKFSDDKFENFVNFVRKSTLNDWSLLYKGSLFVKSNQIFAK